jgi:lipase ATG15
MQSIAAAFIKNTWDAQQYMKTILASDGIVVEWLSVGIFLFVPFLTLSISLFSGWDEWYSLTLTTWFMSIFVFYLFFTVVVIYFEISGAWELLSNGHDDLFDPERDLTSFRKICTGCRILIHMRMVQKLAVKEKITYVVDGSHVQPVEEDYGISTAHKGATSYIGPYARLTRLVCLRCGWFQTLKEPKREFHQNEIDDILPFIARRTWSLGSMHLQNVNAPLQGAIVDGKAALTELQIYSSFGFELLIFGIKIIILYSCLNWLGWGITTVSITVAVYGVIYLLWVVRPSLATKLLLRRKGIRKKNDDIVDSVKHGHRSNRLGKSIIGFIGILRKSTKTVALSERENKAFAVNKVVYRIAEPSEKLCWVILCLEVACFYIFPSISLFVSKNNFVAILFSGIGIVTIFRDHFSPSVLLKDFGSLDSLEKDDSNRNTEWRKKHRINKVAREIGAGSNTRFFQRLFLVFITVYCFLFLSAVVIETDSGRAFGWAYTYDFEYPGSKHDIQYPTCQLSQGIPPLQDTPTSLADIAFLAGLSYETSEVVEDSLQTWFGSSSNVIYHQDVVTEFRKEFESINVESAVEYKFVGFPDADVGIISIRGTENLWDILTDVQLWGGAAIIQCVRFVIPFGSWFNPILERINKTFSSIESSTLAKISFYRQTTKFVEYLQQSTDMYSNYIITGHSLGGGLAMISGAQLQVPSIAISGVNTLISRETFDPPISEEDLDKYTLNIIPDRDLVPMIDDPAQNYQRINCSAPRNDPFNCHRKFILMLEICAITNLYVFHLTMHFCC